MSEGNSANAKVIEDVVARLFSGQKVSPQEFGAFVKAQNDGATSGLDVGEKIPDFILSDQVGHPRSFRDLAGREGLLLVFSRSADW